MKIFENEKKHGTRTLKVLGCPLYVDTKTQNSREQSFLNGLIKTSHHWERGCHDYSEKSFELIGRSFMRIVRNESHKYYLIGGRLVKTIDPKKRFERRYSKYIDKIHDDVYVLNSRSGECYLFLAHVIESFMKHNGSKMPLLVATTKYHVDLIQMLIPEIPYIFVKSMGDKILYDAMTMGDQRLFTLFTRKHFWSVEENIRIKPIGESHYFADMLARLNVTTEDLSYRRPEVSWSTQNSMIEKVKKIGLNLENFVFVAPHAHSCAEYDAEFWIGLCERLKDRGIDVFFNISATDEGLISGCQYKTCELSFSEAFALARMSKLIVSLRSGMSELLTQAGVAQHVIYTKFRERGYPLDGTSAERIMAGFSLKSTPNVKHENIKEYNTDEFSSETILESIKSELCSTSARTNLYRKAG